MGAAQRRCCPPNSDQEMEKGQDVNVAQPSLDARFGVVFSFWPRRLRQSLTPALSLARANERKGSGFMGG